MTMTDPIADLLTRIRNGLTIGRESVSMPHSTIKEQICRVLKEEGFLNDYRITEEKFRTLHVFLKYGPDGEKIINELKRMSKPGCRVYRAVDELPRVLNGLGIAVVSTPKGVMSDRQARDAHVGGEVICTVW